jgi:hypothetical protein
MTGSSASIAWCSAGADHPAKRESVGRGVTFLIYALCRDWHSELALLKKRLRPWSPEDDGQLLDLIESQGKSRHAAAAALGRSKSAVDNRLRVLRASSPVRKESVLD